MVYQGFMLMPAKGGDEYAARLAKQLENIVKKRSATLKSKEKLSFEERRTELPFIEFVEEKGAPIGSFNRRDFLEGEMSRPVESNVRGKNVYLIQSHYTPNNNIPLSENLVETYVCIDSLRHAVANNITLLSLYLPFSRGDKQNGRDGIPAALIARQMKAAGLDRLISMDLHAEQIIGYFHQADIKAEQVRFSPLLIHYLQNELQSDFDVFAPDVGAGKRAEYYAENMNKEMIQAYKQRDYTKISKVKNINILGNPGKRLFAIDDMVNTGDTLVKAIIEASKKGCVEAIAAGSHIILAGDALERFDEAYADENNPFTLMVGSDSVPHKEETLQRPYITSIDTTGYLGQIIYNLETNRSISDLHDPCCVQAYDLWAGTNKD